MRKYIYLRFRIYFHLQPEIYYTPMQVVTSYSYRPKYMTTNLLDQIPIGENIILDAWQIK